MLERKIGEVFYSQILKKWLRVCEDADQNPVCWLEGCRKCPFYRLDCVAEVSDLGECAARRREDGKNVHFEKTEAPQKGGEQCLQ